MARRTWMVVGLAAILIAAGAYWLSHDKRAPGASPMAPDATAVDCIGVAEPSAALPQAQLVKASLDATAYHAPCDDSACEVWRRFRQKHPYPYQGFAGQRLGDGRAVLVLAEPPPEITPDQAKQLLQAALGDRSVSLSLHRWMIGSDGYVQDLVAVFDAPGLQTDDLLSDPELRERISALHLAWFGTTCGGDVETVSSDPFVGRAAAPNLRISASELRRWLSDLKINWTQIEIPSVPAPWNEIAKRTGSGAFVSSDRSLVMLTFPASITSDLASAPDIRADFRRFAVSSDALVGSVWTDDGRVALIGRARTHSFSAVPPLRFETFALLARQGGDELAQSYERTNPLAGRMWAEGHDWAPIYLSSPLIDTEFGELMNVTDQMLKGWSQAGTVKYLYFDYPLRPRSYPFEQPLSELVRAKTGGHQVLFNWNTAGSAVAVSDGNTTVLVGRQLGSLPVTYGSDRKGSEKVEIGALADFEDRAYEYFSGLGDPNLARVVQYTLIYQTFRNMAQAKASASEAPARLRPETSVLADRLGQEVERLAGLQASNGPSEVRQSIREAQTALAEVRQAYPELTSHQIGVLLADRQDGPSELAAEGAPLFAGMGNLKAAATQLERDIDAYNAQVQSGRDIPSDQRASLEAKQGALVRVSKLMGLVEPLAFALQDLNQFSELSPVRSAYEHASARPVSGWIRTPSNVISWSLTKNGMISTGGHNIEARALRLQPSTEVADISLTDDGRVLFNPEQADRVNAHASEIARAVEHRGAKTEDLKAIIATDVPERPRWQALQFSSSEAQPRPAARIGGRAFADTGAFADGLRTMKSRLTCCRVMARDGSGRMFVAEINPKAPPPMRVTAFGDNASLGFYLRKGGGRPTDVVVLDQSQADVSALLVGMDAADHGGSTSLLSRLRDVAGGGVRRSDHVIADDLDGRPTALSLNDSGPRETHAQLFADLQTQTVKGSKVEPLSPGQIDQLTSTLGWDPVRDGQPIAVRISFPPAKGRFSGFDLVAGFGKADSRRTAQVRAVAQHASDRAHSGASVLALQMQIKNSLRGLADPELRKIAFVLREGSGAMQLTEVDRPPGSPLAG